LLIEDSSIDRSKLIKMAIVHDLAEAIVGDFTPFDPISKKEKHQLEFNAIKSFVEELNGNSHANELMELWLEYEQGLTPTALLCKDIDKFEMILQAYEYEKSNLKLIAGDSNLNLESFFESTKGKFSHPEMKSLAEKLYNLRKDA
jgi:putative hydrolase of HD superfamily